MKGGSVEAVLEWGGHAVPRTQGHEHLHGTRGCRIGCDAPAVRRSSERRADRLTPAYRKSSSSIRCVCAPVAPYCHMSAGTLFPERGEVCPVFRSSTCHGDEETDMKS